MWLSITLSASHISGVNISYECLGGEDYLITVNLFRDCQDQNNLPNTLGVYVVSTCLSLPLLHFPQIDLIEVSQLCEEQLPNSTCNGGFQPGVQMGVYQATVQLEPCIDWRIIVSEQNRDGSIINLVDPVLFSVHTDAFLNNSSNICNNSPVLSLLNLPYVCVGTELFYNLGFFDSDGDSLSYALVNAQASETNPNFPFDLDYVPPYSGAEPMPGMTIDPVNGQISVTPTTLGKFNTVVEVREYRNGNLIGVVHYDFLFLVNACPIPPPEVDLDTFAHESGGGYPLSTNTIGVCPEDDFCFEIAFTSVDPSISVDLKSNLHLLVPGATETVTGTNPATIEFCGTLPPDFTGGSFIISAIDDACPVYGQNFYTIDFAFREPIKALGDTTICAGETVQISAFNDTLYTWYSLSGNALIPGDEISCNPCQQPFVSPDTSTYYIVEGQYAGSNCANRDTVFVDVPLSIDVTTHAETCNGNDGVITVNVLTGSGDYEVVWNDIGAGPLSRNDLVAGTYSVELIDNVHGCSRVETFSIIQLIPPISYAGENFEVCGLTANLASVPTYGVPLWSPVSGVVFSDPTDENTSVTVPAEGIYEFIWNEDAGVGCIDSDTVQVTFYTAPFAEIIAPDSVCGLVSEVNANVQNGIPQWMATPGLVFENPAGETTNITAQAYGLTTLYLLVENGMCSAADTVSVLFIEQPIANAGDDAEVCGPNAEISGVDAVGNGLWSLPSGVSSTSNLTDPTIPISAPGYGDFEIIRTLTNLDFCTDTDTIQVRFTEIPAVDIGTDREECDSLTLISFTLPAGDLYWEISPNLIDPGNVASPQELSGSYGQHQAILHSDNGYGCIGSDTININFVVQPHLESLLADTVCGLEYELYADLVGDYHYWVQPNGTTISDINDPNADVNVSVEGNYIFYWIAENGGLCRDTSTVPVRFYDQPITDAGADLKICGLSAALEAVASHGVLIWEDQPGLTFSNQLSPNAHVTAASYGTHIIHLQEINGICTDSDSVKVEFISTPQILNPIWECTGTDSEFQLSFDISLGDTASYEIQGLTGELNNFHFQSYPLDSETPVQVILEDFGYCGGDTLTGTLFCPIITHAGIMDPDTIRLCGDALVEALPTLGATLDGNDTLLYAFHDGSENSLGNIYEWNDVPSFIFSAVLDFSETYYISAVAGNELNGGIDLNDPFLSVSVGTPVEFYELPFGEISGDVASCPYDTVYIPVNLSGDLPQEITYSVANTNYIIFTDSHDFSLAIVDSGAVQLISTQSEACIGSVAGSVQVSYYRIPEISIASPPEICDGDTAFIELVFEGTQPFTGQILQNGNPYQNINSQIDSLGFYTTEGGSFSVVNFSDQNCYFTDTVTTYLNVKPLPELSAGGDLALCTGDTILIGSQSIAGQIYSWEPNPALLQTDIAQVEYVALSNSPFPQFDQVVVSAELNGCFDADTASITVNPRPQPQIIGGGFICAGDSTWLIGYGGADYIWSPAQYFSNPAGNNTQFSASANTVIELTAVSQAGCVAVISTEIEVREKPNAVFGVSEISGCAPLDIQLTALSGNVEDQYNWNLTGISGLGNNSVANTTLAEAGIYSASLTVTSPNGCSQSEVMTENIQVFSTFSEFSFSPKKPDVNHPEVYFANYSPEGVSSIWSVDSLVFSESRNTSYSFPQHIGGSYKVCLAVVDSNLCRATKCKLVKLKNDFEIYVPTAFTPNGDGTNDLFYPVLSNIDVVEYKFWITNPRGRIVFTTTDINDKWDGSTDREGDTEYYGENKIYTWHLIAKPSFNVETTYLTGHVTLLR